MTASKITCVCFFITEAAFDPSELVALYPVGLPRCVWVQAIHHNQKGGQLPLSKAKWFNQTLREREIKYSDHSVIATSEVIGLFTPFHFG